MDAATVERIVADIAIGAAGYARAMATVDPSWGSECFELAGGVVALCGPGLYINAAIGAGHDRPLTGDEWERLESRADAVGVAPAIQITSATHPEVAVDATRRGYTRGERDNVYVHRLRDLRADAGVLDPAIELVEIDDGLIPVWQRTAAAGFGHETERARRANDVWTIAAKAAGDRLFLVVDRDSGDALASASLVCRDGIATVGGMSTVPSARGRGIQSAMIRHRLRIAHEVGCDLAVSTAMSEGSARNLVRRGFEVAFTTETWTRARAD